MNRIDRLTGTLLLLQSHRGITVERIAEHWEVSCRTVFRDLAALGETGVPIVVEPGAGYRLMPGYHVPPIMFTEDEAAALFLSGEVTEQIADNSLRKSLKSALLKVRSALPEERRAYLARSRKSLDARLSRSQTQPNTDSVVPMHDAILKRRCLSLRYDTKGLGTVTHRVVEPLGVIYYAMQWHLIAYCRLRQSYRDFRLDRVRQWEALEEQFQGHADFSVRDFLNTSVCDHGLEPATIIAEHWVLDRARNDPACSIVREEAMPDGRFRLEVLAYSLEWFARWMLGFGQAVYAEQPPALQGILREIALSVAENYSPARELVSAS